MMDVIRMWWIPTLAIVLVLVVFIITEINFRRELRNLNNDFRKEAKRIDEIEEKVLNKNNKL
jgi:hypothetical protein